MEDINSKEMSLRLSVQTLDYRLLRLEEITSATNETLYQIRNLLALQNNTTLAADIANMNTGLLSATVPLAPFNMTDKNAKDVSEIELSDNKDNVPIDEVSL